MKLPFPLFASDQADAVAVAEAPKGGESFEDAWAMPGDISRDSHREPEPAKEAEAAPGSEAEPAAEPATEAKPVVEASPEAEAAPVAEAEAAPEAEVDPAASETDAALEPGAAAEAEPGPDADSYTLADLQKIFPGSAFQTREDFETVARSSDQSRRDLRELTDFLGAYPEASRFYQALAEAHASGGADANEVARTVFADALAPEAAEPDKFEDPDAWMAWHDARRDRKTANDTRQRQVDGRRVVAQRREQDFVRLFDEHTKAAGYDDAQADALASFIGVLFSGDDSTGALRPDTIVMLDHARRHDALVAEAEEKAHAAGYAKAIRDKKKAAKELGAPPPSLDGSTAQPSAKSAEEQQWDERQKRWKKQENLDLSWEE